MMGADKVLGVKKVFKIGHSLAIVLDSKYCLREKIRSGDSVIQFDRGSKITVQSYETYVREKRIDNKLKKYNERKEQ